MNETTTTTTTAQGANIELPDYRNDTCPVCGEPATGSLMAAAERWCAQGHRWQWEKRWNGWYKVTLR